MQFFTMLRSVRTRMTILYGDDLGVGLVPAATCSVEYFSVPQAVQRYEEGSSKTDSLTGSLTAVSLTVSLTDSLVIGAKTLVLLKRRVHQNVAAAVITTAVLISAIKLV